MGEKQEKNRFLFKKYDKIYFKTRNDMISMEMSMEMSIDKWDIKSVFIMV